MQPCLAVLSAETWGQLCVQFKLSPSVLAGFPALGPEPQQIGAYLPIHARPWRLINRLISSTIHRRPLTRGFQHLKRGEKKLERDYFLIQEPGCCESFPGPSQLP